MTPWLLFGAVCATIGWIASAEAADRRWWAYVQRQRDRIHELEDVIDEQRLLLRALDPDEAA